MDGRPASKHHIQGHGSHERGQIDLPGMGSRVLTDPLAE
jgi:hypothetical protein